MEQIDYNIFDIETESDAIPAEILEILNDTSYGDEVDCSIVKVREVTSPFILADNVYDLRECNNDMYEHGVERTKIVEFTGGSFYAEYVKTEDLAFILHGSMEEGYNLFIIK